MKLLTAQLAYEIVSAAADAGAPLTQAQRNAIEPVLGSVVEQYNKVYDAAQKVLESNGTDPRERMAGKTPFWIVDTNALAHTFLALDLPMRHELADQQPQPA